MEISKLESSAVFRDRLKDYEYLNGKIVTYSSKESKEKAFNFNKVLLEAIDYYEKKFDISIEIELFVFNEEDSEELLSYPYGIPHIDLDYSPWLVCLPEEKGVIYEQSIRTKDSVKSEIIKELSDLAYSYEEANKIYIDLIAFHELGHAVLYLLELKELPHWLDELLATFIAYAFLVEHYPKYASNYMILSKVFLKEEDLFIFKTLSDFETHYDVMANIEAENYDWYQKKLNKIAEKLYESHNTAFLTKVKEKLIDESFDYDNIKSIMIREFSDLVMMLEESNLRW